MTDLQVLHVTAEPGSRSMPDQGTDSSDEGGMLCPFEGTRSGIFHAKLVLTDFVMGNGNNGATFTGSWMVALDP